LDVRNNFEYELGTFDDAVAIGVDDFRQFPKAVSQLPPATDDRPIVTFCTGGIRCEKAAPYLERAGYSNVYQLDGGILKYFEECGGEHYHGECFVFDKRVALDSSLCETETALCFVCQATLTATDRQSETYEEGKSCPHCFQSTGTRFEQIIDARHEQIQRVSSPLPGSVPYVNRRPIHVSAKHHGFPAIEFLNEVTTRLSREEWFEVFKNEQIEIAGRPISPDQRVQAGQRLIHIMPATVEPDVNAAIRILFEDEYLVVVDKPAPLPIHPSGRFNRNTLSYIMNQVYRPQKLRPAHRLDANTTGVVILSKTRRMAGQLQPQFELNEVKKTYLARVVGIPPSSEFESTAAIADETSASGARVTTVNGLAARTVFRINNKLPDGTALLEARPHTGRTNQIRVHLWDLGIPVCGDPLFLPDKQLGSQQTLSPSDQPLCLHAQRIEIHHPVKQCQMVFESPIPQWGS
jgi:RluA family pseudouridine synthase